MRRGNVYQIANGFMGYRGTLDEFGPQQLVGITLAGIFDRVGSAWREPVNAPNGGFTSVTLAGIELSALGKHVQRHRQTLQFANALFERETRFAYKRATLTIKSARFLSADVPNLGVIRFSVTSSKAAKVTVRTGIDGNIWDLNGPHITQLSTERRDAVLLVQGMTNEASKRVAVAEAVDHQLHEVGHELAGNRSLRVIDIQAEAGREYVFHKYFSVFTGEDRAASPVADAAIEAVQQAKALGYEACLARHDAAWREKWARCDVQIEGDDEAQQALRYSILQLLMVAPTRGRCPARCTRGQSSGTRRCSCSRSSSTPTRRRRSS